MVSQVRRSSHTKFRLFCTISLLHAFSKHWLSLAPTEKLSLGIIIYVCFTFLTRILLQKFHFRITLLEYSTKPYTLSSAREKMPMVLHSGSLAAFLPQNEHLVRFRACILTIVQYIIFFTFFRVSMCFCCLWLNVPLKGTKLSGLNISPS